MSRGVGGGGHHGRGRAGEEAAGITGGGTRAVVYLLQGQIGRSFQYHPLIPYMAAVLVLEFGSWGLSRLLGRPGLHIKRYDFFVYLGIAVILVNWLVKNYCLVVLGIDLLPGRL